MIALIASDPAACVLFAALVSGSIGFMGCAIFASKTIRRSERHHWRRGYEACNRDHARRRDSL